MAFISPRTPFLLSDTGMLKRLKLLFLRHLNVSFVICGILFTPLLRLSSFSPIVNSSFPVSLLRLGDDGYKKMSRFFKQQTAALSRYIFGTPIPYEPRIARDPAPSAGSTTDLVKYHSISLMRQGHAWLVLVFRMKLKTVNCEMTLDH